jgi:hypothetical protein
MPIFSTAALVAIIKDRQFSGLFDAGCIPVKRVIFQQHSPFKCAELQEA